MKVFIIKRETKSKLGLIIADKLYFKLNVTHLSSKLNVELSVSNRNKLYFFLVCLQFMISDTFLYFSVLYSKSNAARNLIVITTYLHQDEQFPTFSGLMFLTNKTLRQKLKSSLLTFSTYVEVKILVCKSIIVKVQVGLFYSSKSKNVLTFSNPLQCKEQKVILIGLKYLKSFSHAKYISLAGHQAFFATTR